MQILLDAVKLSNVYLNRIESNNYNHLNKLKKTERQMHSEAKSSFILFKLKLGYKRWGSQPDYIKKKNTKKRKIQKGLICVHDFLLLGLFFFGCVHRRLLFDDGLRSDPSPASSPPGESSSSWTGCRLSLADGGSAASAALAAYATLINFYCTALAYDYMWAGMKAVGGS